MNNILEKIKLFFKNHTDIIKPTAVLAIICAVVTLALSSADLLTAKKIETLAAETRSKTMAKLIDADEYIENTTETTGGDITYHTAKQGNDSIGYIFVTTSNGYGGEISVMTATDMQGKIIAVEILSAADETPGLGQNVTKSDWYSQFSGLENEITVVKGGIAESANNEINAVTGATVSSKAVTSAVNTALDYARQIIAKGDIS